MTHTRIKNHKIVVEHLGGWPEFHDYEIVSILLERWSADEASSAIAVKFEAFREDAKPGTPQRRECQITMRFSDAEDVELVGFNSQNSIIGFQLSAEWCERLATEQFLVEIQRADGGFYKFKCGEIEVVDLAPGVASDRPSFVPAQGGMSPDS